MKAGRNFPLMFFRFGVVLVVLAAFLVFQFLGFNVLQDDAFISFRYVRNFLDGGGPLGRFYYRDLLMAQKRYAEATVQDSHLIRMVPGAAELLAARKY